MNDTKATRWVYIAAVIALILPSIRPAQAAQANFECDVDSARQVSGNPATPGRFEIRCKKPYGNSIYYFTTSSTVANAQDVAQMSAMVLAHISNTLWWKEQIPSSKGGRLTTHYKVTRLFIGFDDADVSTGPRYGCQANDCTHITSLSLVPVDLASFVPGL